MVANAGQKLCQRCNEPVIVNADSYEVFEKMHWLCFHLEFEHDTDPDQACGDPDCPWGLIDLFRDRLRRLGVDPAKVVEEAVEKKWTGE
jgi:hypothetical protein